MADDPCHRGHCFTTGGVCQPVPIDIDETAQDGTACGADFTNVCLAGECMVPFCTTDGKACSIGCAGATHKPLADQTWCGIGKFCAVGQCKPQFSLSTKGFNFVPGAQFSGTVANLSNMLTTEPTSALTVTIDWGDGNQSAAVLSGASGALTVSGQHVFLMSGQAKIRVDVSDPYTGASATLQFNVDTQTQEFPLGKAPGGIASGPDGNLWVGEEGGFARVSTSGTVTHYPLLGIGGTPVFGSDGNLWLLTNQALWRSTLAGVATQVPLTAAHGKPWRLAAGPDGNLWITFNSLDGTGGTIVRVTTAGVLTEFPVPTVAFLEGICAGPDGAVWFTEYGANRIGRITTSGVVTEFPIPTASTFPVNITTGPDGNLWFTESGTSPQVGRITPSGTVTEFPSTFSTRYGDAISAGPDGRVWFAVRYEPYVAAITSAGVVTKIPIPSGNEAGDITTGPDHAIWYTEPAAKLIARVVP